MPAVSCYLNEKVLNAVRAKARVLKKLLKKETIMNKRLVFFGAHIDFRHFFYASAMRSSTGS